MRLFILFFLVTISNIVHAQVISPTNPYTKDFVATQQQTTKGVFSLAQTRKPILKDIEGQFDLYWRGKDYTKKGSGYKPFKRWANHWKDYLLEDGTIAPPAVLRQAWEKKVKAESTQNPEGVPNSNWTNLGPAIVDNTENSTSGQGRVNTIIKDPIDSQTLYVGAPAGGIWKSTDDGVNWIPLTDDLPQIGVSGIAIDPTNNDIIYIATGDDDAGDSYSIGVMKSLDGGQTWSTTGLLYEWTNYKTTNEIYIDPTNNNHIWVASTDGLQKSEDGGNTWAIKQAGNIVDFKLHPNYTTNSIIYAVGYNGNESKFYRSSDKGENFTAIESIPTNSNRIVLETTPAANDSVYVLSAYDNGDGTYEGKNSFQGVYVSTDTGLNFTKTAESDDIFGSGQSWYDMALTVSDSNPDVIFVGVLDIWKSTDGGDDFSKINYWYDRTNSFTHADIHFLRYFDNVLYAGTDGGIYRSSDDGDNFEDLSNTLSIAQIYSLATSRNNSSKIASGLQDCGGFGYSEGEWNSYHGGDGMGTAIDPFTEDTYYGMTQYGGSLFRTQNGGDNGSRQYIASGPVKGEWETPLQFNKNGYLYAGYDQLYVLKSGSWEQVSNHNFDDNLRLIEMDPNNSNIIFVATEKNLYRSEDRGKTFTNVFSTSYYYIRKIEVHNTNSNLVWVVSSNEIFKSTDGGITYIDITAGSPSEPNRSFVHHPYSSNNAIYLGTLLGVYYTDDTLNQWYSISNELPNVKVTDMEINTSDHKLTVSTYGRGIWQTDIPSVTKPEYDIDLLDISLKTENSYRCINSTVYEFDVYNNGAFTITDFSYQTLFNNVANESEQWTGNLPPGDRVTIEKEFDEELIVENENTIEVQTSLASESITSNNSLEINFTNENPPNSSGETNIVYTYSTEESDWLIIGSDVWEKGMPTGTNLNQVNSGQSAYATVLDGNHPDNKNSSLVSPCFDVTNFETASASFYLAYEIEEDYDYLHFEVSIDNGQNWTALDIFTGQDHELKKYSYDITEEMLQNSILFRFKMMSDAYVNFEGAVIDDFMIEGVALHSENDIDLEIAVYPNPTTGLFTIDTNGLYQLESVKIHSIDGKLVYKNNFIEHPIKEIDLSNQSKGLYFVELSTSDQRKIIRKLTLE